MWTFSSEEVFITARKRSLGQGNMFTGVSLSTGGGCLLQGGTGPGGPGSGGGAWSWGVCLLPDECACSQGGVPAPGGCLLQGVAWWRPPRWLLLWAVCILLECILFSNNFTGGYLFFKGSQPLPMKHTFSPWKLNNTKWVNMIPCFTPFAVLVNSK